LHLIADATEFHWWQVKFGAIIMLWL